MNMARIGAAKSPTAFGYEYHEVTRNGIFVSHGAGRYEPVIFCSQAKPLMIASVKPSPAGIHHRSCLFLNVSTTITKTIKGSTKYAFQIPKAARGFSEYQAAAVATASQIVMTPTK